MQACDGHGSSQTSQPKSLETMKWAENLGSNDATLHTDTVPSSPAFPANIHTAQGSQCGQFRTHDTVHPGRRGECATDRRRDGCTTCTSPATTEGGFQRWWGGGADAMPFQRIGTGQAEEENGHVQRNSRSPIEEQKPTHFSGWCLALVGQGREIIGCECDKKRSCIRIIKQ